MLYAKSLVSWLLIEQLLHICRQTADQIDVILKVGALIIGIWLTLVILYWIHKTSWSLGEQFLYTCRQTIDWILFKLLCALITGVYTKFSGRLSEEPFSWMIQKFSCILIFKTGQPGCQLNLSVIFKTGQPGCQLNLSKGRIRLDLTSRRPSV